MIGKQFAGVSASLDLTINEVSVNYRSINQIEFNVSENLHDYACVELTGLPPRAIVDYYAAPARFIVSTGASYVHEFYGTVEQVEPKAATNDGLMNGSPFQVAKLHCFGNSYRMRGKKSHVWERVTIMEMAETLADRYGFSLDVPNTKLITTRFVQQSESDWEALVRFSKMHGYRVNVHGTHMHIYDPTKSLTRNRSLHKLGTFQHSGVKVVPGKIMELTGKFGREATDGTYMDTIVPILQPNGEYYELRASDVLGTSGGSFDNRKQEAVDSFSEARAIIRSESADSYDFNAHVKCLGLAGVYPGGVVDLDKYRGGFDGSWYVKAVKHSVNTNSFITELDISRSATSQLGLTYTTPYGRPPTAVYKGGQWVASRKVVKEYA